MPVFNHERFLHESIESCLQQTYKKIELIIVDDGSTDSSAKIARSYKDSRVIFISQSNSGPSIAINNGVSRASGQFIASMSGDDVSRPDRISQQLNAIRAFPDNKIIFTRVDILDGNSQKIEPPDFLRGVFESPAQNRIENFKSLFWHGNRFCAPTSFLSKSLWDRLGGYSPTLYQLQDYELWLRMSLEVDFQILEERLVGYRTHGNNLSAPSNKTVSASLIEHMAVLSDYLLKASPETLEILLGLDAKYESRASALVTIAKKHPIFQIRSAVAVALFCENLRSRTTDAELIKEIVALSKESLEMEPTLCGLFKRKFGRKLDSLRKKF